MTANHASEPSGKPTPKKAARKRAATGDSARTSAKGTDVTLTSNSPVMTETSSATAVSADDKGFLDFLTGILPGAAQAIAPTFGIDPRVAGQTVSQVLNIFGIGGAGKAFAPALPQAEAVAQLKQVVGPHLSDPAFAAALGKWLQAAVEPVQAHKEGKAFQPSVDMSKNWFTQAISDVGDFIGDAVSSVDWEQVGKIGMQALPFVLSLI